MKSTTEEAKTTFKV